MDVVSGGGEEMNMLQINNTIISLELLKNKFVCDLHACKGACCVKGDAGAPLEEEDLLQITNVFPKAKPYMRAEGIQAIEEQGFSVKDVDGDVLTPLVNGKECAYVVFDNNGATRCAFEIAFLEGKTNFRKPISCHLYPARITKYKDFEAVNFHQWDICKPACECGSRLGVKVFRFLKEALVRRFGMEWFAQLECADSALSEKA